MISFTAVVVHCYTFFSLHYQDNFFDRSKEIGRTNERTNEQTNEQTNERTNKRMNQRKKQMNERTDELKQNGLGLGVDNGIF